MNPELEGLAGAKERAEGDDQDVRQVNVPGGGGGADRAGFGNVRPDSIWEDDSSLLV
jgi:hypothetical protein